MNQSMLRWLLLLLGIAAVASSWLSIQLSAQHRYRELQTREARLPGSVSADEWIRIKDDEGMSVIGLILVGLPAFIVVTITAAIGFHPLKKMLPASIRIGTAWILLGGVLHAYVWLS